MHDVKEAQELISEIRRSFHVDDGDAQDPLVENFENAVNMYYLLALVLAECC